MTGQIKITTYENNVTGITVYDIYSDDFVALSYFEEIKGGNGVKWLMDELMNKDDDHNVTDNIIMLHCLLRSGNENFNHSLEDFKRIMSKDRSIYAQYLNFQIRQRAEFISQMNAIAKNNPSTQQQETTKKKGK